MIYIIAKLTENDNGYQYPSGGKYSLGSVRREKAKPGSQPYTKLNGFGHEEWNFNKKLAVDGKIRGYHYYEPAAKKRDDLFTIYFVSYRAADWRLVGVYRNARFVESDDESFMPKKRAVRELAKKIHELAIQGQVGRAWQKSEDQILAKLIQSEGGTHRWLVDVEDATALVPSVMLPANLPISDKYRGNFHETRPTGISVDDAAVLDKLISDSSETEGVRRDREDEEDQLQDDDPYVRLTKAQKIVVNRREKQLANQFHKWLKKIGAKDIEPESQFIDLQCTVDGKRHIFELKSCLDGAMTKYAIRNAIGQILEYSYFPGRTKPDFSAIVLDKAPPETVIEWLQCIHKVGITVEVFWADGSTINTAGVANHPLSVLIKNRAKRSRAKIAKPR